MDWILGCGEKCKSYTHGGGSGSQGGEMMVPPPAAGRVDDFWFNINTVAYFEAVRIVCMKKSFYKPKEHSFSLALGKQELGVPLTSVGHCSGTPLAPLTPAAVLGRSDMRISGRVQARGQSMVHETTPDGSGELVTTAARSRRRRQQARREGMDPYGTNSGNNSRNDMGGGGRRVNNALDWLSPSGDGCARPDPAAVASLLVPISEPCRGIAMSWTTVEPWTSSNTREEARRPQALPAAY
uniref:Uncharacterized protein n=1 Tax=Oryza sativa subsp. japonica TaxID=39947 RepID=Q6ZJE7_ORYSJ|nr:hypothetical protein [Oryza sativa Japonica Group]